MSTLIEYIHNKQFKLICVDNAYDMHSYNYSKETCEAQAWS